MKCEGKQKMHTNKFILIANKGKKKGTTTTVDALDGIKKRDYTIVRVEFGSDGRAMYASLVPCGVGGMYEPVFPLKASDVMAADYVSHWAAMAELLGVPQEKVISANAIAGAMREWKGRKIPD